MYLRLLVQSARFQTFNCVGRFWQCGGNSTSGTLRVTVALLLIQGSLLLKFSSCEFISPQVLCKFLVLHRLQKKCLADLSLLFLERLRISARLLVLQRDSSPRVLLLLASNVSQRFSGPRLPCSLPARCLSSYKSGPPDKLRW